MTRTRPEVTTVDPFDLPDWLGVSEVVWTPEAGLRSGSVVPGSLGADGHDPLSCDLLAVDEAYPVPVASEGVRHDAHQAWQWGQVLVVRADGRLALAVPGTGFTADRVLDAVGRLAKAVGSSPDHYAVLLRIGVEKP